MCLERWLYKLSLRLRSLFRRQRVEDELDEELRFHVDSAIERELSRGLSVAEARQAAVRALGGLDQQKERIRDVRGVSRIEHLACDVRYAVRVLGRSPGFTVMAVLTLAIGIGANTALFSVVDAVLLRPLPVRDPSQLFFVNAAGTAGPNGAPPYPYFQRVVNEARSFEGVSAFTSGVVNIVIDGHAAEVVAEHVSGSYFDVLGLRPSLGRLLAVTDERLDPPAAVVSHRYWRQRLGGDASVVGKAVILDDRALTIAGVAPTSFTGLVPGRKVDIWLPITIESSELLASNDTWWLEMVARVARDATRLEAEADADRIYQSFIAEADKTPEMIRSHFHHIELLPAAKGLHGLRRRFSQPLLVLIMVAGLVLAIACANVANLLLARGLARRREIAVRLALGAGPARIGQQLLTETVLLFTLGGMAGLAFAYWSARFLSSFFAIGRSPIHLNLAYDARLLAFTSAITFVTMLVFGVVPALRAARLDLRWALNEGGSPGATRRVGAGQLLVALQAAFSVVLLIGAGLFLRTLANLEKLDPGFRVEGVLTMSVRPLRPPQLQLWDRLLVTVRALPDVRAASFSVLTPLSGRDRGLGLQIPGREQFARADAAVHLNHISDDYFEVLGTPVIAGREFDGNDREGAPRVAVLNQTAARFYFANGSALGATVAIGATESNRYEIVGVVADASHRSLREPAPRFVYLPVFQPRDPLDRLSLVVRTNGDPARVSNVVRQRIESEHPNLIITEVMTLRQQMNAALLQERLVSTLCTTFGLIALLLCAVGLFGVLSQAVFWRTYELGIRTALGARPSRIAWLVIRDSLAFVCGGIVAGLAVGLVGARFIAQLLYGVDPVDAVTAVSSAALLLAVGLLAAWLPARRAARVDPLVALRRD